MASSSRAGLCRAWRAGPVSRCFQWPGLPGLGGWWPCGHEGDRAGQQRTGRGPVACDGQQDPPDPCIQPHSVVRIFPPGRVCAIHVAGMLRTEQAATIRS